MSLARATISGVVTKSPEKRFTQNNFAITTFPLEFQEMSQKSVVYIRAVGKLAEDAASKISKGDSIVAEGRLQLVSVKTEDGNAERKIAQIDLSSFEKFSNSSSSSHDESQVVQFAEEEIDADDLLAEDEIPF